MTLRSQIIRQTLEAAIDAGDQAVIDAARRLARANLLGWKKYAATEDKALVLAFA